MKKSAKSKSARPQSASPAPQAVPEDGSAVATLRGQWPPLTDVAREAYDSLATDAQRAELGAKTRSESVLDEGTKWAVTISGAFKGLPAVSDHYSAQRFAYFLDALCRLEAQRRLARSGRLGTEDARAATGTPQQRARNLRDDLVTRLGRFAGKRETLLAKVSAAAGGVESNRELADGLEALAGLCESWPKGGGAAAAFLAQDLGLTQRRADAAREAARTLRTTDTSATLAGKLGGLKDDGATNVIEGAVLLEMQAAMHAFDDARQQDPAVPHLTPGPGTRSVLAHPRGHAQPPPSPAPTPS